MAPSTPAEAIIDPSELTAEQHETQENFARANEVLRAAGVTLDAAKADYSEKQVAVSRAGDAWFKARETEPLK